LKELRENPLFADGIRAIRHGRFESAVSFFQRILASDPDGEAKAAASYFLGRSGTFSGDIEGAAQAFSQAGKDAPPGSPLRLCCMSERALLLIKKGDRDGAASLLELTASAFSEMSPEMPVVKGMEPEADSGLNGARALYLHYKGIYEVRFGDWRAGAKLFQEALEIFSRIGFREESAAVYDSLGQHSFERGDLEEALYSFRESLAIKEETGDRYGLAITWGNLGRAYLAMADYDKALYYFGKDLEYTRSTGDLYGEMVMLNNTGRAKSLAGDLEGGKKALMESLGMAERKGSELWKTLNLKDLAHASLLGRETADAGRYLDSIRDFVSTKGNRNLKAEMCLLESELLSQKGDPERALELCNDAASIYGALELPHEMVRTDMKLGAIYLERGDREKALQVFEESLEQAERLKAPWLVSAFEKLIHSVGEEEWIRVRLRRYLGREVLDEVLAGAEQSALGGNRQKVTVLVSDIRGYTEYSENRSPEEIVAMLNEYFSLMVDVIVEQKGTIDKFIGDAIMSYFGAPITYGDDSAKALRAAQCMMEALEKYNRIRAQKGEAPIRMGIGIATGEAVVGNIGSYSRRDFTVVGHTVSKAFGLCSTAQAGQILASPSTWEENCEGPFSGRWKCHEIKGDKACELLWAPGHSHL
jgi:class 3 adenylate cyclase/Flp pilus assembly protein TadD